MEQAGLEERIDHRSFASQGRDEQPTIHEGAVARVMEKKGFVSDRCELNRQIRRDNALLKSLKAAITKLTDSLKRSIPAMAELLESIRARLLVLRYSATHARVHRERAEDYMKKARPVFANYNELISAMQAKTKERKALLSERDELPSLAVFKRRELTEKIQGLTEEIEEMKNEETAILHTFHKEEAAKKMAAQPSQRKAIAKQARKEISDTIAGADAAARRHAEREVGFNEQYQEELHRFDELRSEMETLDPAALTAARLAIRPEKEQAAFDEIHRYFPDIISVFAIRDTVSAVDSDLHENGIANSLRDLQRHHSQQSNIQKQQKRKLPVRSEL